jgi:hypothetical protein
VDVVQAAGYVVRLQKQQADHGYGRKTEERVEHRIYRSWNGAKPIEIGCRALRNGPEQEIQNRGQPKQTRKAGGRAEGPGAGSDTNETQTQLNEVRENGAGRVDAVAR